MLIPAPLAARVRLWVAAGLVTHGLFAGLSLAALHRASLRDVPVDQNGAAAGIYSMIRFGGMLLGAALGGVLLQQSLETTGSMIVAYQAVFWLIAFWMYRNRYFVRV